MKKLLCMVALAAISFGSVYAAPVQEKTVPVQVKKKKVTKKATTKHTTHKVVKKDSIQ
jgi:uncharacterized membrane protein